jgi:hypothetical protein
MFEVKLFTAYTQVLVVNNVNNWLKEQGDTITLISATPTFAEGAWHILISYQRKTE